MSASPAALTHTCGALGSIFLSKSDFLVLGLASRSIVYHPERCRELLQVGGASACRSASAVGSCRLTMCVCVWCVPQKIGDRSDEDLVPLVQLAQTVPLFQQLSPPLVRMLCRSMRYLIMPRNTVICREGELGNLFYILLSGEVGCWSCTVCGRRSPVACAALRVLCA